jgi:hypothetical protein
MWLLFSMGKSTMLTAVIVLPDLETSALHCTQLCDDATWSESEKMCTAEPIPKADHKGQRLTKANSIETEEVAPRKRTASAMVATVKSPGGDRTWASKRTLQSRQ